MSSRLLTLCRCVDRQLWSFQHPLRQFEKQLSHEVLNKIESRKMELHRLKDMTADEIGENILREKFTTLHEKILLSTHFSEKSYMELFSLTIFQTVVT